MTRVPRYLQKSYDKDLDGKIDEDALYFGKLPVQADSVAADVATLVTDFNALLTKLKTAGLMDGE